MPEFLFTVLFLCFLLDFVFVQGTEVIFKVALCLLSSHEKEIIECDSFESIVDFLKTVLPTLTEAQMEQTITKVQTEKWSIRSFEDMNPNSTGGVTS